MKATVLGTIIGAAILLNVAPVHADGFITPFIGYNFGGDSGNCPSLRNCSEKHTNYGVSFGAMGSVFGVEEDVSFAKHFFGDAPDSDNSVFSLMTNFLAGIGVGPVQPYALAGLGLIRQHASAFGLSASNNALGYDVGGGVRVSVVPHVGIRADIRHLHTLQDVNVPTFTGQRLNFLRASVGLAIKY